MVTSQIVREILSEVQDPEIGLGIVDLGLVYDIECNGVDGEDVLVTMTLTSPMCPFAASFQKTVLDKTLQISGVKEAKVELTFNPLWDVRTMASEEAKLALGIW